jgi:hypothetical protein
MHIEEGVRPMSISWRTGRAPETTAPPPARPAQILGGATFGWVVLFAAFHVYWGFGGQFGFGDASITTPKVDSAAAWAYTIVLGIMFVVGAVVSLALYKPWGLRIPGWTLVTCSWIGGVLLTLRGLSGLLDTLLRGTGLLHNGLTGLTYQQELGDAHPSAYTLWSSSSIDMYFFIGGVLFCVLAVAHRQARRRAAAE